MGSNQSVYDSVADGNQKGQFVVFTINECLV